jgi:hypothetical protein
MPIVCKLEDDPMRFACGSFVFPDQEQRRRVAVLLFSDGVFSGGSGEAALRSVPSRDAYQLPPVRTGNRATRTALNAELADARVRQR